ncbi:MAG TPA: discoidin domain-containing protein [Spirochaetota bacterium]|nr:discoidin domain-containing protein [Spirochaetota bacterium]
MDFIDICKKRLHKGSIHASTSSENDASQAANILSDKGFWCTKKRSAPIKESVIIDFEKNVPVDYLRLEASSNGTSTFPVGFRFEGSSDANEWCILYSESNTSLTSNYHEIFIPLTVLRYLKLVITDPAAVQSSYYAEIGKIDAGLYGLTSVTASSSLEGCGPERMFTGNNSDHWESEPKTSSARESLIIDLGRIYCINRLLMVAGIDGFPEQFHVETSIDEDIWITLFQEKNFDGENAKRYFWITDIRPARYVRIESPVRRLINGSYALKITDIEISAAPMNHSHTHNMGDITPHASVFHAGMARLARDGENLPGTVVQASDSRLRDASTVFKGIIQLANNNESTPGLAVQADDSRLQLATETKPGIVKLAHNRETNPGAVVQSNDSRIQHATNENFGIVRICADGEYIDHSVVSGNDSRIQPATTEKSGICRLSLNGGTDSGAVVQASDSRLKEASSFNRGIVKIANDGESSDDSVVLASDRRLRDATTRDKGIVELAEDGEELANTAVQGNDKRLKDATTQTKGIVELAEDGEDKTGVAVQGNDKRLKDATTQAKGIVELAEDGENRAGVAVQGNDKRLKDATESAPGILKFSPDGGIEPYTAVQGNDRRLRDATTKVKGIVELAEDGEDRAGVAVQGNDKRLKDANTQAKGIVELAEDGEDKAGVAVQGNDKRLKDANTQAKGIVELAEDGEDRAGVAVQGNDKRLKDATAQTKGIVKFAIDGGTDELTAVQGNDKRLKPASTINPGIVELADDGEDRSGIAVQGNDKRLKHATEKNYGIMRFASDGDSLPEVAVQSNDSRLFDSREPLPHNHDYAPLKHNFNSHTGSISIKENKSEPFRDITPPSDGSSVIYGNNSSSEKYSIGITGVAGTGTKEKVYSYGVFGHSSHVGVRGQSSGKSSSGAGVAGLSRFGAGGIFSSEHAYSLVADGSGTLLKQYDENTSLSGEGKGLLVLGSSEFNGQAAFKQGKSSGDFPGGLVEYFEVDDAEYITAGDILAVSDSGNSILSRSRTGYNPAVIGVVSGNPLITINNSGKEEKIYPVALAGKVLCRIDARNNPVKPGDLIVSSDTPGCGMRGKIDSFDKTGTVIGKALSGLSDGIDLVPVFILSR